MKLGLQSFQGNGDVRLLGQKLTPGTPAVLLFMGGTPELAQFTQGLEKQARQRYIVALADVNLQTLLQMGAARNTPVIATQPVPLVNSALPVVRQYRETLTRLFDEAPTPLSLAGFIAARYTFEVLNAVDGTLNRQSVLAGFQQRASLNIGGFRIAFNAQRRSSSYVTQSMLALDGRLIG
jgi:ABC-type branched-subunit amino acid transport system substrate-binding protein